MTALRLLVACLALLSARAEVRHLTILHTNDLHAHLLPDAQQRGGFAQLAAVLHRERTGCDACIYLNAGDLVQGTSVSTLFLGSPVYEISNLMQIDAATIGNHEFDYGWRQALRFLKISRYPMLSANIVDARNKLLTEPYLIKTINGVRIAIIGAVMSDLVFRFLTPKSAGPYHVLPVVETVARYAKEVRDRSDLIVVLAHIEAEDGVEILKNVHEVSVVIEGHDHRGMEKPAEVEGRVAAGCRGYGVELGRLDLDVDLATKKLSTWSWKPLPVDAATIPADTDVKKAVDVWEGRVSKLVDVRIGEAKRDFATADVLRLVEKAIQDQEHADFAFMNAGGIRDRLTKGPILARHVWNILPFDNRVVVARVAGRLIGPEIRKGRVIEPDREYTLATADYVVENESQRARLGLAKIEFKKLKLTLRDLVIQWIRKQRVLE